MNSSQKIVLFILVLISACYVYFSFFSKDFKFPDFAGNKQQNDFITEKIEQRTDDIKDSPKAPTEKNVKIYLLDKNGDLRPLNRTCNANKNSSCFEYAIRELISAPSKWEKSHGFATEIPPETKVISVREGSGSILVDLSSDFEMGGGTESIYMRVKQLVKTAKANTSMPVYLYINGKQADVIGGDGIMIKQPLSERSFNERN